MNPIIIPWKTNYYYRNRLNPLDRAVYDAIFKGLQTWQKEIPVPVGMDIDSLYEIFSVVIRDCPLFFHVTLRIWLTNGYQPYMVPEYRLTQQEYAQQYKQVCDFVRRSVGIIKNVNTTYEKLRSIHSSMVRHVIYRDREEEDSHNVVGAILKRKAVCESIAKAFKLICDANCIPCVVIFGRSNHRNGAHYGTVSENHGQANHAWNMVKVGENWYNIDVTWDVNLSAVEEKALIRYDYFCRSDQVFNADHIPMVSHRPSAPKDIGYYRVTKAYAKDEESLRQFLRNELPKRKQWFCLEYDKARFDYDAVLEIARAEIYGGNYCKTFSTWLNEAMGVVAFQLNQ